MFTLDQLEQHTSTRRAAAERRRGFALASARDLAQRARQSGRRNLTAAEDTRFQALIDERDAAVAELAELDGMLAEIAAARGDERQIIAGQATASATRATTPGAHNRATATVQVTRNARTYHRGEDPHGRRFLLDVARSFLGNDPAASARLADHMREERVERADYLERAAGDSTTTNWAGLVVPQYLTDLVAAQISPLRPFADVCTVKHDLPPAGLTVNFSKVTTGTSVDIQSAELAAVSATSIDDTLGTASVQTFAGQQTLSRQAIDRGTGIEDTTIIDLGRKLAADLDFNLLNQASTGLTNIAQTVTYTDAAPTASALWPFLFQAQSKLEQALEGVAYPTHFVMHSRRWNWLTAALATSFPLIGGQGVQAQQSGIAMTNEYGPQVRGRLPNGMLIVVDNNIATNLGAGTNQDEIYCVAAGESVHLAEDPQAPVFIRAEQPKAAQLGVLLVIYEYAAYFSRYANPASKISGTGLVAPSGF